MSFTVVESSNGGHVLREVKVGVRVFPGAAWPSRNRGTPDHDFTLAELGPVIEAMHQQVRQVYREFAAPLQSNARHRVTYRFAFQFTPTQDPKPLSYTESTANGYRVGDPPSSNSRTHASALREAVAQGVHNLAVVYRRLGRGPCAPRLVSEGSFQDIRQAAERPGTLNPISNTMVLCGPEVLRPRNQTVAHEVGHLLGMADWRFPGPEIMCLPHRAHPIRSLTPRVENRLHDSANFNRPGRIGGPIEDLGQLTNPDAR